MGESSRDAGYAGDISVGQAWERLASEGFAILIDVRSEAEWSYVGVPDLSQLGKQPLLVAWQSFPSMQVNPDFAAAVAAAAPDKNTPLLFICRSGVRSRAAAKAVAALGYSQCFNIAGGFEGDLDADRHRGRLGGWKAEGLPWVQS